MFCMRCGKKLGDNDRFCLNCGAPTILAQNSMAQPPVPAPDQPAENDAAPGIEQENIAVPVYPGTDDETVGMSPEIREQIADNAPEAVQPSALEWRGSEQIAETGEDLWMFSSTSLPANAADIPRKKIARLNAQPVAKGVIPIASATASLKVLQQ